MQKFLLVALTTILTLSLAACQKSVGNKGPGGGLVFYAENGRYMECSEELGSMERFGVAMK
jgi:hypothetical protein